MTEQENFDDLIRRKLAEEEFPFDEQNWEKAAGMIDASRGPAKKPIGFFIFSAALIVSLCVVIPMLYNSNDGKLADNTTAVETNSNVSVNANNAQPEMQNNMPTSVATNFDNQDAKPNTENLNTNTSITSNESGNANETTATKQEPRQPKKETQGSNNTTPSADAAGKVTSTKVKTQPVSKTVVKNSGATVSVVKKSGNTTTTKANNSEGNVAKNTNTRGGKFTNDKQLAAQKAAEDKAAAEKLAVQKAAEEKAAAEKAAIDKANADKAIADKAAADQKAAEEKAIADKAAADKAAADKLAADRSAEEKALADKLAAEKLLTVKTETPATNDQNNDKKNNTPPSKNVFWVEAGGDYLLGWKSNGTRDANGFNLIGGLNFTHLFTNKIGISVGAQYNSISNINTAVYTAQRTSYDFGVVRDVTTVSTQKLHYITAPVKFHFAINNNNSIGAGVNVAYLINSKSTVETYTQRLNTKSNTKVETSPGYYNGFASPDVQLSLFYKRRLYKNFGVNTEFIYGLSDVKNDAFFGSAEAKQKNIGFKLTLTYDLFKK